MKFKLPKTLKPNKHAIFFIVVTLSMVAMIWFGVNRNVHAERDVHESISWPSARVVEVINDQTDVNEVGARVGWQDLRVRLLSGARRGDIIEVHNMLFPIEQGVFAREGDRVILYFEHLPGAAHDDYFARVQSFDRAPAIYIVVLVFFALLAVVFGKTGIRSAFGLVFTFVVIIFLLIPLIVRGHPPALLTLAASLVITAVSLIAIMGFEKKTYVSIIGTAIGIACYAIFYLMIGAAIRVTGFNINEADTLIFLGFNVRVSELLFCGILIASLGALMDVAVSLASVAAEFSETNPKSDFKTLFRSGMRIGRDIIGSSVNTLILAFTGTFFISLIFSYINNLHYNVIISRVDIGVEVLRAISASAAMILCAPATALIGSRVYAAKQSGKKQGKKRVS
ncbi:MAG: YibE/F family protein [Oscillospiraceae bacterium]|nr:YibE/F family protein [Oscillospiraceae bacterium]